MSEEFTEGLFAYAVIFTLFGLGVILFHCLGLMIMRIRDIRTGRKRILFLRRVL